MIRHFMTMGNREKRYVGLTDESILPGEAQNAHISLEGFLPERVYTSDRKRTVESASLLFSGVEQVRVPGLREMDFGEFEYKNYLELSKNPDYQAYIDSNGAMAFPGGETRENQRQRTMEAFYKSVFEAQEHREERIAFVVHGGTIMAVMSCLYPGREYFDYRVPFGCGYLTLAEVDVKNKEVHIKNKPKNIYRI